MYFINTLSKFRLSSHKTHPIGIIACSGGFFDGGTHSCTIGLVNRFTCVDCDCRLRSGSTIRRCSSSKQPYIFCPMKIYIVITLSQPVALPWQYVILKSDRFAGSPLSCSPSTPPPPYPKPPKKQITTKQHQQQKTVLDPLTVVW